MVGESSVFLDNSGGGGDGSGGAASSAAEEMVFGGGGEEERGRGEAGNRWPREETLALLKIRSDMDLAFRDSTLKAPLWDEVSRKLGELGFHRSARKCKEKFENIFKYHKRTKDCRSGRQNGKSYRFFEQLEMFDNQPSLPSPALNQIQSYAVETTSATEPMVIKPTSVSLDFVASRPTQSLNMDALTPSTSTTSSSGRDSEGSIKKKRKLVDYFEKLMREVLEKQENLQNQLLNALEKCERERMAREEAWKKQQMDRIRKEQEILAHERAIAAAKDAAVMAFLQKISEQTIPMQFPETPVPVTGKHAGTDQVKTPSPLPENIDKRDTVVENNINKSDSVIEKAIEQQENGANENFSQSSASRWPKAEVEALVRLRTNLGMQFQDNGLKGPLWEEVSLAMKKLGYDRNAKRCKEKWENINKYYRRVKESQKRRPESSKTCPYFHLLDSLYERKSNRVEQNPDWSGANLKPEDILMQMMNRQQQQHQQPQQPQSLIEDGLRENMDQNREDEAEEDDEEEDDENGNGYELVANKPSSVASMGVS
ncbi:hypothetical protein M9H77_13039 [Catharanthus roseus]|uniref:Uncharacterized protein n=1 Tax=Catharanthus roseus TaxID=4058 RepID=A0ACC0BJ73_CATRO|nr:hypothetical protein M9H77_13039 [Catharanthus roseus]